MKRVHFFEFIFFSLYFSVLLCSTAPEAYLLAACWPLL
jgi:hypothetical protein